VSVARKIVFSLAVLLLALLAAEPFARLAFRRPLAPFVPSANQKLIYELNPAYPGINALGMAQGPVDLARLHDRLVIAVIGDSHTYSIEMSNHAYGFPARLEHALNAEPGEQFTVLNFGVPGYNTVQELEVLRAKALRFEPDLIILQYCINDEHISNYIQPQYPWLNRAIHHSVLATTAWTTFVYSGFGRRQVLPYVEHVPDLLLFTPGLVGTPVSRDPDPAHGPTHPTRSKEWVPARYHDFIGRDNLERAVRTFGDICRPRETPVLATGFIESRDERLYTDAGMRVYSFFTIFEGQDIRRYGYDPARTDGHFSVHGNDAIGKALARYIRDHFTLRRRG
jgi:lysophospholipase L1-like esterase